MNISISLFFLLALQLSLSIQSAYAKNGTVHFNFDGTIIDKIKYEIIVYERNKAIANLLENGYDIGHDVWRDPIKLRKKRIKQWREMRKRYNPESLSQKSSNDPH